MEIFHPGLNFSHLISDVVKFGGVFVEEAITHEYIEYLLEEVESLEFSSYQSDPGVRVYEKHRDFRARLYETEANISRLREFSEQIGWNIRRAGVSSCRNHEFYPDDLNIWRYAQKDHRIDSHRDFSHDIYFIVGVTLKGYCTIEFHGDVRENPRPTIWQAGPGSLMLLRAPGLCEGDSRPYHAVNAPVHGERISAIIRQDERNSDENCGSKDY